MKPGHGIRPTCYVTRVPSREAWSKIMDEYRRNGPTLGVRPGDVECATCANRPALTESELGGCAKNRCEATSELLSTLELAEADHVDGIPAPTNVDAKSDKGGCE